MRLRQGVRVLLWISAWLRPRLGLLRAARWTAALCVCGCSVYEPGLLPIEGRPSRASAGAGATFVPRPAGAVQATPECTGSRPTCVRDHAAISCAAGSCRLLSCQGAYRDCDGRADNGCEADLSSNAHCGRCGASCSFAHGVGHCAQGRCALLGCHPGYADCDGNAANGCESALDSPGSCGACGRVCAADRPQASAVCRAGQCVLQCRAGYGDCNARAEDGCEQPLTAAGACGPCTSLSCVGPRVTSVDCASGPCEITSCALGFEDCNGSVQDGCEADLLAAANCGSCFASCSLPHVAATRCESGVAGRDAQCAIDRSCGPDELDCDLTRKRGCAEGYADCDGATENGCETDLRRLNHCGGCGSSCVSPRELSECRGGMCVSTGCAAGHARCAAQGECLSLQDDPQNCGACGRSCPSSAAYCAGGRCTTLACNPGSADCDGDARNRCETGLNALDHCGGCDVRCGPLPHARSVSCRDGTCQIGSCDAGFADCDGDPKNGCEVSLDTDDDCGGCGMACHFPQGVGQCRDRKCALVGCTPGRGDCNRSPADGCEHDLRTTDSCGRCGHNCNALPHVAAGSCSGGTCQVERCQPNFADCDGLPDNGCEADLRLATSCGSCQNDCSKLANVAGASCDSGRCVGLTCSTGFGDCNADRRDGCERPLSSVTDCGACQRRCQPAHAPAECSAGVCGHGACEPGYADCDGNAENGCEARLDSPNHCGACGNACEGGAPCKNGQCGCARDAQCGPGESCCNNECLNTVGTCFPFPCIPGTAKPENNANCGGCGQACLLFCCGPLL